MNRMFLAALLVTVVVIGRMVFIPEASVWGSIVTYSAVLGFFAWCLACSSSAA